MDKDVIAILIAYDRQTGEIKATHYGKLQASDLIQISKYFNDQALQVIRHVMMNEDEESYCGAV